MVVREIIPRTPIPRIVLANGSPCTLAEIRPPAFPVLCSCVGFGEPLLLCVHIMYWCQKHYIPYLPNGNVTAAMLAIHLRYNRHILWNRLLIGSGGTAGTTSSDRAISSA